MIINRLGRMCESGRACTEVRERERETVHTFITPAPRSAGSLHLTSSPLLFRLFSPCFRHVGHRAISGLHNQPSIEDDQLEKTEASSRYLTKCLTIPLSSSPIHLPHNTNRGVKSR